MEKVFGHGLRNNNKHRPMWPMYQRKTLPEKQLLWLEIGKMYDEKGTRITGSTEDSIEFIQSKPCMVFTRSLTNEYGIEISHRVTLEEIGSVLCSKVGKPICARTKAGRSTSWIVSQQSWIDTKKYIKGDRRSSNDTKGMVQIESCEFLRNMRELYGYYGLGMYPTPGSLGQASQTSIHFANGFKKHTALSLAAEDFLRKHSVGGIVITPGLGMKFDIAYQLDESSAYVAHWKKHPYGTAIAFDESPYIEMQLEKFATYFAKCTVTIVHDLPMGIFPIRNHRRRGRQVDYPTLAGTYKDVYLWKEQIQDCRDKGLYVRIQHGYAWLSLTREGTLWSEYAYQMRQEAPTKFIREASKKINVASIGYHGMGRTHFVLVSESQRRPEDRTLLNDSGEPLNIYIREEQDTKSAHLNHWNKYTVMQCNRDVNLFAWQFAEQERLIMVDYDGIVTTVYDQNRCHAKGSEDAKNAPAGSWIVTVLHELEVLNHRSYRSREQTKTPGIPEVI